MNYTTPQQALALKKLSAEWLSREARALSDTFKEASGVIATMYNLTAQGVYSMQEMKRLLQLRSNSTEIYENAVILFMDAGEELSKIMEEETFTGRVVYPNNINPEAVPAMLEALKAIAGLGSKALYKSINEGEEVDFKNILGHMADKAYKAINAATA